MKVVIFGGAGQAGREHMKNLQKMGAIVASYDIVENEKADLNFNAKTCKHIDPAKAGYKYAIVSLPDNMLYKQTDMIIDAGFERIMVEKPGSRNSFELDKLVKKAQRKGVAIFINYQRQYDERIIRLCDKVK